MTANEIIEQLRAWLDALGFELKKKTPKVTTSGRSLRRS